MHFAYIVKRFPSFNSRNLPCWAFQSAKLFQQHSFNRLKKYHFSLGNIPQRTGNRTSQCAKSFGPSAQFWHGQWGPQCWFGVLLQFVSVFADSGSFIPNPVWCSARPRDATEEGESRRVQFALERGHIVTSHQREKVRVNVFNINWLWNFCWKSFWMKKQNLEVVSSDSFVFRKDLKKPKYRNMWSLLPERLAIRNHSLLHSMSQYFNVSMSHVAWSPRQWKQKWN